MSVYDYLSSVAHRVQHNHRRLHPRGSKSSIDLTPGTSLHLSEPKTPIKTTRDVATQTTSKVWLPSGNRAHNIKPVARVEPLAQPSVPDEPFGGAGGYLFDDFHYMNQVD